MFTGIIEEIGEIKNISSGIKSKKMEIKAKTVLSGLQIGESVNINGACQTVIKINSDSFVVEAVKETLKRSNLDQLRKRDRVNLERALRLSDRLGGHLLSGHIDCTTEIKSISSDGDSSTFELSLPSEYSSLIVGKGSIAVEGISLTVADLKKNSFTVSVIPFTLKMSTLGGKKAGDLVNLEFDLLGKYVQRLLERKEDNKSKITEEWLKKVF
ncbi:MAG TPA: riboflavin synthase [Terriglobales bacterium]|nr:riboflavin synthase [Terriglobales bacterium]